MYYVAAPRKLFAQLAVRSPLVSRFGGTSTPDVPSCRMSGHVCRLRNMRVSESAVSVVPARKPTLE